MLEIISVETFAYIGLGLLIFVTAVVFVAVIAAVLGLIESKNNRRR